MASATRRGDTYTIRTSLGYDSKGKQIQKFTTWKPAPGLTEKQIEKELERQKVLFDEKCKGGRFLDGSMKFADYADYWLAEYAEKQLRPSTVAFYKLMLKRINAAIGHIKLEKLQPNHLMQLYSNLSDGGLREKRTLSPAGNFREVLKSHRLSQAELSRRAGISVSVPAVLVKGGYIASSSAQKIADALNMPVYKLFKLSDDGSKPLSGTTVLRYHRTISSMLEKAVKWQIIFSNPAARVESPKAERKEARYLDEKQAADLIQCLQDEPLKYRTMITLLLYSGMRRGELCGLEWPDVDFANGLIDINKTSIYVAGKGRIDDTTKTFASKRVIKLPSHVMALLAEHRKEQMTERLNAGDKWVDGSKLFTQWDGRPIYPGTVTQWFIDFIKRHDLPEISLHSLRHTCATLLIFNGTDLRTVSKRLGHANMTTTANVYTHAIQTADERASEVLSDILSPNKVKQA